MTILPSLRRLRLLRLRFLSDMHGTAKLSLVICSTIPAACDCAVCRAAAGEVRLCWCR